MVEYNTLEFAYYTGLYGCAAPLCACASALSVGKYYIALSVLAIRDSDVDVAVGNCRERCVVGQREGYAVLAAFGRGDGRVLAIHIKLSRNGSFARYGYGFQCRSLSLFTSNSKSQYACKMAQRDSVALLCNIGTHRRTLVCKRALHIALLGREYHSWRLDGGGCRVRVGNGVWIVQYLINGKCGASSVLCIDGYGIGFLAINSNAITFAPIDRVGGATLLAQRCSRWCK